MSNDYCIETHCLINAGESSTHERPFCEKKPQKLAPCFQNQEKACFSSYEHSLECSLSVLSIWMIFLARGFVSCQIPIDGCLKPTIF